MGKRRVIFALIFLILALAPLANRVHAQEAPTFEEDPLIEDVQAGTEVVDQLTDEQTRDDYLKQEWKKVFQDNKFLGPIITFFDLVLDFINPFTVLAFNIEAKLSWAFIFGVLIVAALVGLIGPVMGEILGNKWFGFGSAFVIACLIGLTGVVRKAVDVLTTVVTQTWIAWISFVIALIVVLLCFALSKNFRKMIAEQKEADAKIKQEQDRAVLSVGADSVKEQLKT